MDVVFVVAAVVVDVVSLPAPLDDDIQICSDTKNYFP